MYLSVSTFRYRQKQHAGSLMSCMIGKATLEDFPKAKCQIFKPLYQVHTDSFSSSVKSIEGYNHAIVFVDSATGYRWLYGLRTKDDAIKALRKWYSDIADLRTKHKLVVLMRGNASQTSLNLKK